MAIRTNSEWTIPVDRHTDTCIHKLICACVCIYTHIYIYLSVCNKCTQFLVVSDCDPMDCSTPGSSIHGIFLSRVVEWVAISYSRGIFLTQGLNLCLLCVLNWQTYFLSLCHLGSPYVCVYIYIYVYIYTHTHTHAAAAASLQSCPTLCDPIDSSQPSIPSLGFSRQEHWSGLPFPSPMHESDKWKWSRSVLSDS